jgi:putative salt-induced outer membrane protein YdiY
MQRSGSFGNSGIAQMNQMAQSDMQRNMGNIASGMRMQDYTQQQQLGENAVNRNLQAGQFNANLGESMAGRQDSMYNQGQGRALSALGMAPTFAQQDYNDINQLQQAGAAYQGQNQKLLDNQYAQFLESRQYPMQQLDVMGNALGRSYGQTNTTTQPGPSTDSQLVGGALTGAGLYNLLFGG